MADRRNARLKPIYDLWAGLLAAFSTPRVRALVVLTGFMIGIASVFYSWVEGWGWINSIYFSVITISTVGYGDFAPQTLFGKLFTIFYVLCGLGVFVATATAIADSIINRAEERGPRD